MAKIWEAICNAVGRRETAAERDAVLGAAPYTFRPPEPPPMPEFPTERPMTARQREFEEQTRRDFAAGKRSSYVNFEGRLRSFTDAAKLESQREAMAKAFQRIDNARADLAATGYTGGPPRGPAQLSAVREAISAQEAAAGREWPPRKHFGRRTVLPDQPAAPRHNPRPYATACPDCATLGFPCEAHRKPNGDGLGIPLPIDGPNVSTMVIREDLEFLRRIAEIRLTGGRPAIIDFDRQTELGKVIAYTIETADANGELAGMRFLRAWSEGSEAAAAELRAYILDEKPY